MAEIRLSDYAGHIFLEMVKAREMADAYSRAVAERYAQDSVMRHFPAPRFRVPKIQLSIPVLVSSVRFNQLVRFEFPIEDFMEFIVNRAHGVRVRVQLAKRQESHENPEPSRSPQIVEIAYEFHERLVANREPRHPDAIVTEMWAHVFTTCLGEVDLLDFYSKWDPVRDLLTGTTKEVLDEVRRRTVVDRSEVENLLVNPETNVVKNGSSETGVLTVNVEMVEEGIYFRSVRDEDTGRTRTFVEFD
ncbi:hypothetical protein GCM10017673_18210 [Streptosporangium violaceochromogenes]|nr:hypothetical protein GCM10017673_18210 [Streptosporangium violaceochromogenes]